MVTSDGRHPRVRRSREGVSAAPAVDALEGGGNGAAVHADAHAEAGIDPAGEAWLLMRDLYISQRPQINAITGELGLGPADALALHRLDPSRPQTMGELAHDLSYDSSNITGIVDRLEQRGYVKRRADPRDRRVKLVSVTATGERVRRRLIARMAEAPPALARLSEEDQVLLRDVLRRALGR
jgi:DNA-binding MarR family transcriptional regulator